MVIENQSKISTILDKYPNTFQYIKIQDPNYFKRLLLLHKVNLVCINIPLSIGELLDTLLSAKEKNIKTFMVLQQKQNLPLEYNKLGIDDFVYCTDSELFMKYRILKLLDITKPIEINVQRYEYITYIPPNREIYIKDLKISLTTFESLFVNYLLSNNGYCNMQDFEKYLNNIYNRRVSRKSIVVGISRFKRKVYVSTKYVIIKCRYGLGYVINT